MGDVPAPRLLDRVPCAPSALRMPHAARPGTPKDASERTRLPEILHERPPAPFPRSKSPQLSADRLLLRRKRRLARREIPHPPEERRHSAKAYGCVRADNASPIPAAATFARYARPTPLARTRRTADPWYSTPSYFEPGYQQSPLYSHRRSGLPVCRRRLGVPETERRLPRYILRRGCTAHHGRWSEA